MVATIRVLLADDHQLVRSGIRALLQGLADVEVVGEAETGRQALELIAKHRPQIVLMDVMMPELNGLEATGRITREFPETRVIVLSMNSAEEYVLRALKAGAAGYLLKNASLSELDAAIRAVAAGQTFLSSAVSQHVIDSYVQRTGADETDSLERLTARQREVLQLIAEGLSTKRIARKLHLSDKTVETHRMHLMERLDIHDIPGLVRYAIRKGIVSAEHDA